MKSEKSIQLVSLNGIVFEGPGMIEGIYEHCVVALSYKSVMVIGGKTSSNYQYQGPELLKGRQNHACTSFERDRTTTVYVVGGNDDSFQRLNSNKIAMIDKASIFGFNRYMN